MKNLYMLPNSQQSKKGDIVVWNGLKIWDGIGNTPHHNQNIYITNSEKPKEGDWAISPDGFPLIFGYDWQAKWSKEEILKSKKIILTDNKDLIKDGVQAIDDEFLQWFVKNPSCEVVSVKCQHIDEFGNYIDDSFHSVTDSYLYKIIITKEETDINETRIQNECNRF